MTDQNDMPKVQQKLAREDDRAELRQKALQFYALRQAIGVVGLILPLTLLLSPLVFDGGYLQSISAYYHTVLGDFFVGCLAATGVFLVSYLGYPKRGSSGVWQAGADFWVSTLSGIAAIGVALFPVDPVPCGELCRDTGFTGHSNIVHYGFAIAFFAGMAVFCLRLFPIGQPPARARYFRRSGWAIVVLMVLLGIVGWLTRGEDTTWLDRWRVFFLGEIAVVLIFAAAWLEKGRAWMSPYALLSRSSR